MWATTEAQQPLNLTRVEDADAENLMKHWWSTETGVPRHHTNRWVLEVTVEKICRFFPMFSVSRVESRLGHAITCSWEVSAAAPRWLRCNWLSAPPAASLLRCNVKNFWDTPHWWVLFDCSPAWVGGITPPAIGSCAELVIPASWLLWTRAKYFFQLSIRGISTSGRREARLGECVPYRCGWGVHSKMYMPVSCSDVRLLLEGYLLTTGSLLWLFHTWKFSSIHRWLDVIIYRYTGAGCGMCIPTPQQRISDHLFSPSGDHKI